MLANSTRRGGRTRELLERDSFRCASAVLERAPLPRCPPRCSRFGVAARPAQALDLLQHPLELVLGARELLAQAGDVAAAGEAQVAHDEVAGVEAELGQRHHVLGRPASSSPNALRWTSARCAAALLGSSESSAVLRICGLQSLPWDDANP